MKIDLEVNDTTRMADRQVIHSVSYVFPVAALKQPKKVRKAKFEKSNAKNFCTISSKPFKEDIQALKVSIPNF